MLEAVREIGHATPVFQREITREMLVAYQQALGLTDPVHADEQAARAAGYRDVLAPAGFVIAFTVIPREIKLSAFGVDESRALAGGMTFDHRQPVCAGDVLTGRCELVGLRRTGGDRSMTVLTLETRLTNQRGELALIVGDTTLERAE